jgi:type II restriction enzyme
MSESRIIGEAAVARRERWIAFLEAQKSEVKDDFRKASEQIESDLRQEREADGNGALFDHLRLCGDIPEAFAHDSTAEKLYSKYTDSLLAEAFKAIGLKSLVLQERADAADVEAFADDYSFVADAKSFRLSRTAKNQKDFKVQSMDGWKHGKPYAMIVCPIYQLPSKSSQIYQQASARNVCLFTYSHLAVLVSFGISNGGSDAIDLLHAIFKSIPSLNTSKGAPEYWQTVNGTMLRHSPKIVDFWQTEKLAAMESLALAKESALTYLAKERARIMALSHDQALKELVETRKIQDRIKKIRSIATNEIMEFIP